MKLNLPILCLLFNLSLPLNPNLANAAETVWISSLDLSPITQGWGKAQTDKLVRSVTPQAAIRLMNRAAAASCRLRLVEPAY